MANPKIEFTKAELEELAIAMRTYMDYHYDGWSENEEALKSAYCKIMAKRMGEPYGMARTLKPILGK